MEALAAERNEVPTGATLHASVFVPEIDSDHVSVLPEQAEKDETPFEDMPQSLEAATRLVDPMRINNLSPAEITPRYLRRAARAVRRAHGVFNVIQHSSDRLVTQVRHEAQRGQKLARTNQGQRRAVRVRRSMQRSRDLRARFEALDEERARFARRTAAANDLYTAWQSMHFGAPSRGQRAALSLRGAILGAERHERMTRNRLEEAQRAINHLNAAEDAMLRDGETVRLDPVTFTRFAGRGRWSVRLAILAVVLCFVAVLYPPWSPPRLTLACLGNTSCLQLHSGSGLRLVNPGNSALIGLANITMNNGLTQSTQVVPIFIMPRRDRSFTCGDFDTCALNLGQRVSVNLVTTGGTLDVHITP